MRPDAEIHLRLNTSGRLFCMQMNTDVHKCM